MWKPIEFVKDGDKRRMVVHLPWKHQPPTPSTGTSAGANEATQHTTPQHATPQHATPETPTTHQASEEAPPHSKPSLLKRLFTRKKRAAQGSPPPQAPDSKASQSEGPPAEQQKKGLWQKLFRRRAATRKEAHKRDALQRRRKLEEFLLKAGYEVSAQKANKRIFLAAIIATGLFTAATFLYAIQLEAEPLNLLIFYGGVWLVGFWFVYFILLMALYVYLDIRIYRRTKELEDVLPDFLQLASANIAAGMPIDRALWFAVRPNFGVLAKEIEEVARATIAGEELSESLTQFTKRYDSVLLKRSVSILLEGLAAGGEIADLLDKIAMNIQETKILRKEMSASVATYAIFITFASIVMAPLLFGLGTQLLTIIIDITSGLDLSGSTNSFLTLNINSSEGTIANFRWFSVLMLSITALMSGMIVSTIRRGRVKEGIHLLPIFVTVSLSLYALASWVLGKLLGGLI